ncbi:MAG: cell shape determining protein MreB/Mrl family [Solirubrobacterales bacterium]|jgi:rod shape-determining protein MreB|nr:cell shape determining protein MreB/Mrl family [Solirubrobacterales bacterium]MCW3025672.1 cell shape determining protein MreB/Mrl family [Solirubrobacterales bacterium]
MVFSRHLRLGGGSDLAIDLGTANTLVYVRGHGIAVSEPSVVAQHTGSGRVLAVGDEAKRMIGRTPATITASRPLRHGVIADLEVTEEMLRQFITRVHRGRLTHPRVVMCVPSGLTEVELSAVQEACLSAGALEVHLIDEPIAAAVGAGLDISAPTGRMVVDIGGGTSEVAIISMGAMVVQRSLRIAGYDFDDAIISWLRRSRGLIVGQPTAEALKVEIGSAAPQATQVGEVRGRDAVSGLPRALEVSSDEVREALHEAVQAIVDTVRAALEQTPPELSGDVADTGILLAGGSSLLAGFPERLSQQTGMPARLVDSPLTCVAEGAGRSLEGLRGLTRKARISRRYSATSPYRRPTTAADRAAQAGQRD